MKTNDLLKYFLNQSNLFTIKSDHSLRPYQQVMVEFCCGIDDIFNSQPIAAGHYLVTFSSKGLKPNFVVIKDDVIRYFTFIEEE